MTMDISVLIGLLPPALAAAVGAYFSARLGVTHAERAETSRFRRESAEYMIVALTPVRDLLRDVQQKRDAAQWIAPINIAYDAIENSQYRVPVGFRHLKRSIRFALGEAVGGVSWADMALSPEEKELSEYNHRWNEYAIEYIDMALGSIREWRDAPVKTAPKVHLPAFDPWLAKTGRYVIGHDSAPA